MDAARSDRRVESVRVGAVAGRSAGGLGVLDGDRVGVELAVGVAVVVADGLGVVEGLAVDVTVLVEVRVGVEVGVRVGVLVGVKVGGGAMASGGSARTANPRESLLVISTSSTEPRPSSSRVRTRIGTSFAKITTVAPGDPCISIVRASPSRTISATA